MIKMSLNVYEVLTTEKFTYHIIAESFAHALEEYKKVKGKAFYESEIISIAYLNVVYQGSVFLRE